MIRTKGVAFYLAVPQQPLPAQKAGNAQQEEGGEAAIFFFLLKLKPPKKRKCCPCNLGRDLQLLFSLSEWQISSSILEGERKSNGPETWDTPGTRERGAGRWEGETNQRGKKRQIKSDCEDEGDGRQ